MLLAYCAAVALALLLLLFLLPACLSWNLAANLGSPKDTCAVEGWNRCMMQSPANDLPAVNAVTATATTPAKARARLGPGPAKAWWEDPFFNVIVLFDQLVI